MDSFKEFIKKVLSDPYGFLPDSVAKSLNGVDLTKIALTLFTLISSGVTIDKVLAWVGDNSTSFGLYSGLVTALVALVVQFRHLWTNGKTEPDTPAN